MIKAYPKIFAIGTDYISDIFSGPVQVTEKVDGSQFGFGKINGELFMRSKGAMLYSEHPEKMFLEAILYIESIAHDLPEGIVFYAEYLKKPKHNTLCYDRVPKNNLMLFGAMEISQKMIVNTFDYAEQLGIEHVPVLHDGIVSDPMHLKKLLEEESILGGAPIEGVVVKNFGKQFLLGGNPIPVMAGKFVSEAFKETNRSRWGKEENGKSKMDVFFESFRTVPRWEKAVQHLRDSGKLDNSPKDIGNLIKEIQSDIEEEEKEAAKEALWNFFKPDIKRRSTHGFPEWYKNKLLERGFYNENN